MKKKLFLTFLTLGNIAVLGGGLYFFFSTKRNNDVKREKIKENFYQLAKKEIENEINKLNENIILEREKSLDSVSEKQFISGYDTLKSKWISISWDIERVFREMREFETTRHKEEELERDIEKWKKEYQKVSNDFKYSSLSSNEENEKLFIYNFIKNNVHFNQFLIFIDNTILLKEKVRLLKILENLKNVNDEEKNKVIKNIEEKFDYDSFIDLYKIINQNGGHEDVSKTILWALDFKIWVNKVVKLKQELEVLKKQWDGKKDITEDLYTLKSQISSLKAPVFRLQEGLEKIDYIEITKEYFNFLMNKLISIQNFINEWNKNYSENKVDNPLYYKNFEITLNQIKSSFKDLKLISEDKKWEVVK